jgi:molybdopterin synthase sulfur carrier subunit
VTKLVYFAWVRERIGKSEEDVVLPAAVTTVADLLLWLKARGDGYAHALRHPEVIRVAINHEHVDHGEKIAGAAEIALFPPMTGG